MTAMIGLPAAVGPNLDLCTDTPSFPLGAVVEGLNGKAYRYVQFVDAVPYVAGHFVCLADTDADEWKVTNDRSGGSMMAGLRGVGLVFQTAVPTENQYGWVQIAGVGTALMGSAAVIAGDLLKPDSATDGAIDEATEGTSEPVAVALATIADTETGKVLLTGLRY